MPHSAQTDMKQPSATQAGEDEIINNLVDFDQLSEHLASSTSPSHADCLGELKQAVQSINDGLKQHYYNGGSVESVVLGRAHLVDRLLTMIFENLFADNEQALSLVAVGGYGRGELHPKSDIDLMILLDVAEDDQTRERLEAFLTLLWDIKLEIGHSVRTVDECVDEATRDITVTTNIMEARLLAGDESLYHAMKERTGPDHIWNSRDFFQAKTEEQVQRNGKFNDTAYNLEPNIKESRGGLRDIQMVGWVAKRHFNANSLHDLVEHDFLLDDELESLLAGQRLLWQIRCSLHYLAGRREDRLLFDYQRDLAHEFGFEDNKTDSNNEAIEQFMQQYYRTVIELERLNEMLLQHFREAIVYADAEGEAELINDSFQVRHGYLETTSETLFRDNPCAILEMFVILEDYPDIQGVRAETIREVRRYRHLIDDDIRKTPRAHQLFMKIMNHSRGVTHELRRMNRYGVLASYIPAFDSIVGRMQYDLFHAYTVDQHTLFVIRNMRRLSVAEHCDEFPLASGIFQHLPNTGLLYLAGLFHDIAKGRKGDHSELGAVDAYEFCKQHGLTEKECKLVSWLVRKHLIMSMTAQRKDLSDPEVIREFAEHVGSVERLDYLYLLTISDIRATNPKQWNSWKDKLLSELYNRTASVLNVGIANQSNREESIQETQTSSLRQLEQMGINSHRANELWQGFNDDYFRQHTPDEIVWHTSTIINHDSDMTVPLVESRIDNNSGTLEVMIYMQDRDHIFYDVVTELSNSEVDIISAQILRTDDGHALEMFRLIPVNPSHSDLNACMMQISQRVIYRLEHRVDATSMSLNSSRKHRYFSSPTQVNFKDNDDHAWTAVTIETLDRTGVLANIAKVFNDHSVRIIDARITSVGEIAIDHFIVTTGEDKVLDKKLKSALRKQLLESL